MAWTWLNTLFSLIIFVNTVFSIFTVFREKRGIAATWGWLLVLTFIPVFGFLLCAFLGRKLTHRQLAKIRTQPHAARTAALKKQEEMIPANRPEDPHNDAVAKMMIKLFQNTDDAFVTMNNHHVLFTDGTELFADMRAEMAQAKHTIFVEFYTFYADELGNQMLATLTARAKEGVAVRVLYDSWGSMGVRREFFEPLRAAGGIAEPFLGIHSNWIDFRLNFRNHRKIVAIDGWVGYIGGFNIGDQYVGRKAKFGNWRDTHMKVTGDAVLGLQAQFTRDWNATVQEHPIDRSLEHFPERIPDTGDTLMQIVASGPESDLEQIKLGYLKLINAARNTLYIQTPYLIPDDSVLTALRSAVHAGVDVRIMIPHMPDHAFVYRATQYYAHLLANDGVKIYYYQDGFIHAKTVTVDDSLASIGSANFDVRSLKLNFECNAFIYDHTVATQLHEIFDRDLEKSTLVTAADFHAQPLWLRFKQTFSRLLSPIL